MNRPNAIGVGRALLVALALAASAAPAAAQFRQVPPPAAYALRNVTVVDAGGARTTGLDLVVRAGRIEALGRSLDIPVDAEVLAGDSLLVYPGIVDAWGTVKFEFPRDSVDRRQLRSWEPPRAVQGFTPHRQVLSVLDPTEADLAALRKKGVVAVAVHPTDGLMPGRGALLLLRPEPPAPAALAVQPTLAPVMTFRGARGLYPSTGMAVPAFFRQTLLDVQRHGQLVQATPRGGVPPAFDADYAVLRDALGGTVYFHADQAEQIRHVLRLADEFGFRPVILGGAEAWQLAPELQRRNVPVVVSLDFPEPRRWKPAKADTARADTAAADSARAPAAPPAPATIREQRELEAQYANAGRLSKAGVRIALASGGKADIREGARKAIEYGLAEAAALRAVTAAPAALYGIDRLAEVAAGQPATFVVTSGPIFEENTRVAYTFVEGVLERGTAPGGRRAAGDSAAASASGEWTFEVRAGVGEAINGAMTLVHEGETLSGRVELGELGEATISDGSLVGDRINMTFSISAGGQQLNVQLNGTYDGETMSGTGTSPMGPFDWSARRNPGGAW